MKASVVIPAYNSKQGVEICLLSLIHQRIADDDSFEVVVVDDGSSDGTRDVVRGRHYPFELNYVHRPRGPESGRAAARNAGIREASGELIVMVDADQMLPPDFLAEHIRYHMHHAAMVVLGPRHHLGEGRFDVDRLARGFTLEAVPQVVGGDSRESVLDAFSHNLDNLSTAWHYLFSCNASVRREHLLAVGGFDESFVGWGLEDSELGYRLRRFGLGFAYNRHAVAYHLYEQVIREDMYDEWLRNLVFFTDKHGVPEVAAQRILARSFDPRTRDLSWLECCQRFEYAVRALHGRLPGRVEYRVVRVDEANRNEVVGALADWAGRGHLLVLDRTADREIPRIVQCSNSEHEVVYYRISGPEEERRILSRHPIADPL